MIKTNIAPKWINLADIVNDQARNVREFDRYELENLVPDLQIRGQITPSVYEKIGDKFYAIQGFRREAAIRLANDQGLKFDESAPVNAGKPMDRILAIVHENLTERERIELLLDHGQRLGLNKVELYNSFKRAFASGYTDKEIVILLRSLLEIHYPPKRTIGEGLEGDKLHQALFEYYKGVLQTAKRAYKGPEILETEYVKKLRGEQKFPSNTELTDLVTIFDKEIEETPVVDGKVLSRANPGPKFMEKWNKLRDARAAAVANGDTRPKASAMRNRSQVEDSMKQVNSPLSKIPLGMQLGDIPIDQLPVLDKLNSRLWELCTPEEQAWAISLLAKPAAPVV